MRSVMRVDLPVRYQRPNGTTVFDLGEEVLPFPVVERSLVKLPAKAVAGNHRHPRSEAFHIGFGLQLHWIDDNGETHIESSSESEGRVFVIPSMVPHAVVNELDHECVLIEWADGSQRDVEAWDVL
jgi:quercetin dioxygenase-like cupin family protein